LFQPKKNEYTVTHEQRIAVHNIQNILNLIVKSITNDGKINREAKKLFRKPTKLKRI